MCRRQESALSKPDLFQMLAFAQQVADGLKHIHYCNVIHCDLAARNVFVDKELNVKVCSTVHAMFAFLTFIRLETLGKPGSVGKGKFYNYRAAISSMLLFEYVLCML